MLCGSAIRFASINEPVGHEVSNDLAMNQGVPCCFAWSCQRIYKNMWCVVDANTGCYVYWHAYTLMCLYRNFLPGGVLVNWNMGRLCLRTVSSWFLNINYPKIAFWRKCWSYWCVYLYAYREAAAWESKIRKTYLKVACGHVERYCISTNVVERTFTWDIFSNSAKNHAEFNFLMEFLTSRWNDYRLAFANITACCLQEKQWLFRHWIS